MQMSFLKMETHGQGYLKTPLCNVSDTLWLFMIQQNIQLQDFALLATHPFTCHSLSPSPCGDTCYK